MTVPTGPPVFCLRLVAGRRGAEADAFPDHDFPEARFLDTVSIVRCVDYLRIADDPRNISILPVSTAFRHLLSATGPAAVIPR